MAPGFHPFVTRRLCLVFPQPSRQRACPILVGYGNCGRRSERERIIAATELSMGANASLSLNLKSVADDYHQVRSSSNSKYPGLNTQAVWTGL